MKTSEIHKPRATASQAGSADLTPKQAAFVTEYLIDRNATQAAIRAGYSSNTAESQGSRLLSKAKIKSELDRRGAKIAKNREITAELVLNGLLTEAERIGTNSSHGARVAAWRALGEYLALFKQRHEIETATKRDPQEIKAEVKAALAEIDEEESDAPTGD